MQLSYALLALSSLSVLVHGQATAQQTIVPFATLPSCAKQCGKLFDVQGACSPPNVDASNTQTCFCADPRLTPFKTGTAGPCDQAACPASDLTTIQQWYQKLCGGSNAGAAQPTATTSSTTGSSTGTSAANSSGKTSSGSKSSNGGGSWISTHSGILAGIIVIIIAIIGGWIGAFFLRRRYLKRKEREYELRPPGAPWVEGGAAAAARNSPYGDGVIDGTRNKEARSSVFSAPGAGRKGKNRSSEVVYSSDDISTEKPKRKWTVTERT